jgi:hypothetical protein
MSTAVEHLIFAGGSLPPVTSKTGPTMSKVCPHCGVEKPLTREYFKTDSSKRSGFRRLCLPCSGAAAREPS